MNKIDKEGFCLCPECGKRFRYHSTSVYKVFSNEKRTYYCCYTCWKKNGGGNKRVEVAGRKIRESKNN